MGSKMRGAVRETGVGWGNLGAGWGPSRDRVGTGAKVWAGMGCGLEHFLKIYII